MIRCPDDDDEYVHCPPCESGPSPLVQVLIGVGTAAGTALVAKLIDMWEPHHEPEPTEVIIDPESLCEAVKDILAEEREAESKPTRRRK